MPHKAKDARNRYLRRRYRLNAEVRRKTKLALQKWRRENKDKVSEQNKRAHTAHRERDLRRNREWWRANRDKIWKRKGLPEPTRSRPKHCELCGKTNGKKLLAYDHCHATMLFRGWLCNGCNTAIGKLGDNIEGVLRLLDYLLTAEAPRV